MTKSDQVVITVKYPKGTDKVKLKKLLSKIAKKHKHASINSMLIETINEKINK